MPNLTERALFMRSVVDDLAIIAQSSFIAGAPSTRVQYQRPRSRARSTDASPSVPAFFTLDKGGADIRNAQEVWQFDASGGGSYISVLDEFNSAATADCFPFPHPSALSDALYIGFREPFESLSIDVATAGVGTTMSVQYFNGANFQGAGAADNTNSLTTSGVNTITWTAKVNWAKTSINGGEELYYIAFVALGTYSVRPILDKGTLVSELFDPINMFIASLFVSHDGVPGSLKWRVRFDDVSAMSSPTFDSGTLSFERPWSGRDFSHATLNPYDIDTTIAPARYMRMDLWASDATYIDIGRIMGGKPIQPIIAPQKSTVPTPVESLRRLVGSKGESWSIPGAVYLQANGTIMSQNREEAEKIFAELFERQGVSKDLLYLHLPKETGYLQQHIMHCRFDSLTPTQLSAPGDRQIRFQLSGIR